MKAMVLTGPDKPFEYVDLPDPIPGPGEAVAKVISCGAGLTIQHIRAGRTKVDYPRIIGHELTGEIVAVGKNVDDLSVGTPVTAYFYLTCGTCKWCQRDRGMLCENFRGYVGREIDGAYAELIKLPAENFIPLPENLDYKSHPAEIGVITDAIATPIKVIRHARIQPGETVAVIGAGGGLGIHMVMVCHWAKARTIAVDKFAKKLKICQKFGAEFVVDVVKQDMGEALLAISDGKGIDAVIDFVCTNATIEKSIEALGPGGRLVLLGGAGKVNPFKGYVGKIKKNELAILGSRYATQSEVRDALEIVGREEIWPLVSETYPLDEAELVHERLEKSLITGRAALLI